jgi:hypothetical protein
MRTNDLYKSEQIEGKETSLSEEKMSLGSNVMCMFAKRPQHAWEAMSGQQIGGM